LLYKAQGRGKGHQDEFIEKNELKNLLKRLYDDEYRFDIEEYDAFLHSNVIIDVNGNVLSQGFNSTQIVGNI
jgi:hypothetical protein